jgi:DNA-directed RNA polymerase specialized sigma24 family protein
VATGSSTLVKVDSDGGLVLATLAGDNAAFAALYDRFATRIYDFHLSLLRDPYQAALATHRTFRGAVADLNHLGEPTGLRAWLYARAYRQARQGAKAEPGENLHWDSGLALGHDPRAGMWQTIPIEPTPKDAALITLHLRHGLSPEEISSVIGLTAKNARARLDKLQTALEPTLRTWLARQDPNGSGLQLDTRGRSESASGAPVGGAVPGYTSDEHPPPLLIVVPFSRPPVELREALLRQTPLISAHQGLPRPRTRVAWMTTLVTAVVLIVGTALFVHRSVERRPVIAVRFGPSSELTLSTTMIDLGASAANATITLSNTGNNVLTWHADSADPWLTVSPPAGSLAGGQSQQLTVTADRNTLPEGDGQTELRFISSGGQGQGDVAVALREERPPAIIKPRASNTRIGGYGCPTTTEIRANITDESPPIHVVLVGPGSQTQVMKASGDTYTGKLGSGSHSNIIWRIIATDSRNNSATSPAQTVLYADCAVRPAPVRPAPATPREQPKTTRHDPGNSTTNGGGSNGGGSSGDGSSGDGSAGDGSAGDRSSSNAPSSDGSDGGGSSDGGGGDDGSGPDGN